ncbi:hypothetical protein CPB84DRAFT_1796353 [Gymnopilus junonius]|uniref:HNH nuclease domain-containing protein n=1 Tax=Gymnopilus junonius TaxID=109634 RepID=A0A9P5TFU5_GYMJU|nr:hypothetical protein CPB84DRAFT_1796353 [Gymnopilus junonius]
MAQSEGTTTSFLAIYISIRDEIVQIQNDRTRSLDQLRELLSKTLTEFSSSPLSLFQFECGVNPMQIQSVQLDRIMSSMLNIVEACGGSEGERYVASAVVACAETHSLEEDRGVTKSERLRALGVTWLTHFLFPFVVGRGRDKRSLGQYSALVSENKNTEEGVRISQRNRLLLRDGFSCVATCVLDDSHPRPDEGAAQVWLEAARILPLTLSDFDTDEQSDSYQSALLTLEILRNIASLQNTITLTDLARCINHESNMMMLESNTCSAFNRFEWCLKSTEEENMYTLQYFRNTGIVGSLRSRYMDVNAPVEIKDRSAAFMFTLSSSFLRCLSHQKSSGCEHPLTPSLSLPNPYFISIHAALFDILHASSADTFFNAMLRHYAVVTKDGHGREPAPRCWVEFEQMKEIWDLREVLNASIGGG